MTSKPKVYQNYRFDELMAFAQRNPRKDTRLVGVATLLESDGAKERKERKERKNFYGLEGWDTVDLQPLGILGMVAYLDDPALFGLSTAAARVQQATEWCTRLQERTEDLRGGALARKRKRVYDLIGGMYHTAMGAESKTALEEKDWIDLFHALEELQRVHFVRVERTEADRGRIVFASSPVEWCRDRPIWLIDARGQWILDGAGGSDGLRSKLGEWLTSMEEKGWSVEWPEAEGTKTAIVEQLSGLAGWSADDRKLTKDVLAGRLGRHQTLTALRAPVTLKGSGL